MTRSQLRDLAETKQVTLDGKPALIGGWQEQFAAVGVIPGGPSFMFSWQAVEHVLTLKNGAFRS